MNIRIERISEKTFEGFYRCLDEVAQERKFLGFTQAPSLEKSRTWVMQNIEKGVPQYVALAHEQVIGWADISPDEKEGFTHRGGLGMGIIKAFRGKGIGKQLLEAVLQGAQAYGLERIELGVFASNTSAIALYRKMGFRQEGVKKRARYIDGVYDDVVNMAKFLGAETSSESLKIVPVTDQEREWLQTYLQANWGAPQVISRGIVYQADRLSGFIAYLNGKPAGLITYHIEGDACEIVSLDSDVEGVGIGTALLEAVRKEAVSQGCKRLWLITTNNNIGAIRFYQKRGYTLVAVYRNAIQQSRRLKTSIPEIDDHGIPIRDEVEFELLLPEEVTL
jgi:DNA-3-methyladenine glycosylase I